MLNKSLILIGCLLLLQMGCASGGSTNPVLPSNDDNTLSFQSTAQESVDSNRYLWGLWQFSVDPDSQTVLAAPQRIAGMHLNATYLLEVSPCTDCLTIDNFDFSTPGELSVDITLRHPFENNLNLTGFDVRGVFITDYNYYPVGLYPLSWWDDIPNVENIDLPFLINYDGYTKYFNPLYYPEDSSEHPIFKYYTGEYANSTDLSAVLNPFLAYSKETPRRMFLPGTQETRTARILLPGVPFEFGYAIDACWAKPPGPVTDPETDFPPEANCVEAYRISVTFEGVFDTAPELDIPYTLEINDHQGKDGILFAKIKWPDGYGSIPVYNETQLDGTIIYKGYLNDSGHPIGVYPLFAMVRPLEGLNDPSVETGYNIIPVEVVFVDHEPVAMPDAWPLPQTVSKPVQFFENGSYDPDGGDIVKWEWDWESDGTYDAEGELVSHTFGIPGDHEVNMRVTDDEGSTGVTSILIQVKTDPGWARTWGSGVNDTARSICTDNDGNIITVGTYSGAIDFDPGPGVEWREVAWPGYMPGESAFVSKFDSEGIFQWVRVIGGDFHEGAGAVAIDSDDNIYLSGYFFIDVRFEGDPSEQFYVSNGDLDILVAKYDSDGNFIWARTIGGEGRESSIDMCTDGNDNVYMAGFYAGTIDFDPGPGTDIHELIGTHDAFLLKMSPSGDFIWAGTWGGWTESPADWTVARAVDTDASGNVYVAGSFITLTDFDPGGDTWWIEPTSTGWTDCFLSKLSGDGTFQWAVGWGGVLKDESLGVAVDVNDDIFVTGYINETVDFDPGPGVLEYTAGYQGAAFLSKFDPNGELFWAHGWGSDLPYGFHSENRGISVDVDDGGFAVVTGIFSETVDFDPGPGIAESSSVDKHSDMFVTRFDPNGIYQWHGAWGGPHDWGGTSEVTVGPMGHIYCSGNFWDTVDFDPGPGEYLRTSLDSEYYSNGDAFITYFPPDGNW